MFLKTFTRMKFSRCLVAGTMFLAASWAASAATDGPLLAPDTGLRISVIQWMPSKGTYERWEALGGQFVVSQSDTITLPVVGLVSTKDMDTSELASELASKLQQKLMMVQKPEVTIEITEYPPVYIVGDVAKPGEYRFRPGMTVLQALAVSGGERRSDEEGSTDDMEITSGLRDVDADILRSTARIARLEAEMSGVEDIKFPTASADDATAREIFAQERIVFAARANELKRQTISLSELRNLLEAEIRVLGEKIKAADANISTLEQELTGVKSLVDKGIATASRRSDIERTLAGYKTDRLDQVTAEMRARQAITEATRNAEGLMDRHKTEVATSLQVEQANLSKLMIKRDILQKRLLEQFSAGAKVNSLPQRKWLTFEITRKKNGMPVQVPASAVTAVMPNDVISATLNIAPEEKPQSGSSAGASAGATQ